MLGRTSTVFFDFDGVLAESVAVKTDAFYEMYLPYGEEIAQRVKQHHLANGGVSRFEKFKVYNGQWLGEALTEARIAELAAFYANLVLHKVAASPEVKGTVAFLQKWHKSLTCYIITGTPTDEIRAILALRNMTHYFKAAYGSPEKKGYWVQKIMTERGLERNEVVFVGDALADKQAAEENNIPFILRQTEENTPLFETFTGPRIFDITTLEEAIISL